MNSELRAQIEGILEDASDDMNDSQNWWCDIAASSCGLEKPIIETTLDRIMKAIEKFSVENPS
jgi:regulator of RNase E activity RraB